MNANYCLPTIRAPEKRHPDVLQSIHRSQLTVFSITLGYRNTRRRNIRKSNLHQQKRLEKTNYKIQVLEPRMHRGISFSSFLIPGYAEPTPFFLPFPFFFPLKPPSSSPLLVTFSLDPPFSQAPVLNHANHIIVLSCNTSSFHNNF